MIVQTQSSGRSAFLRAAALAAGLAVAFGIYLLDGASRLPAEVAFGVLFLAFVLPPGLAWASGRFDPLETGNLFLLAAFFALWARPLLYLVSQEHGALFYDLQTVFPKRLATRGAVISLLGVTSFYVGYYALQEWGTALASLGPWCGWPWQPSRVRRTLFLLTIGSLGLALWILRLGGFSLTWIYLRRGEFWKGWAEVNYIFNNLTVTLGLVGFIFYAFRRGKSVRLGLSVAYCLAAVGLISILGSRGMIFAVLLTPFFLVHYCIRRIKIRELVLGFVGMVIFSALFATFRGSLDLSFAHESLWLQVLLDFRSLFTGWENFLATLEFYPNSKPFYRGAIAFGEVIWLIPRRFWPGKPLLYGGGQVQQDLLPGLWDVEAGAGTAESFLPLGYGYAELGIPGACLAMAAHGLFWRTFYEWLRRHRFNPAAAGIYGLLAANMPVWIRGYIGSFVVAVLGVLLPVMVFRFLGLRTKRARLIVPSPG